MNVFPNAKSKLLGADTHATELTGSDTHSAQLDGDNGIFSVLGGNESELVFGANVTDNPLADLDDTQSVNRATPADGDILGPDIDVTTVSDDTVLLTMTLFSEVSSSNTTLQFRRNGVNFGSIFSVTDTNPTSQRFQVIDTPGAGTFTYDMIVLADNGGVFLLLANLISSNIISLTDDTHFVLTSGSDTHSASLQGSNTQAAELTGDNTQATQETEVIP